MKKMEMREVEVTYCDVCGEDAWGSTCTECGKDFCYDCRKKHLKEFQHSLHFSGSSDGKYCLECVEKLTQNPTPLFQAYLTMQSLIDTHNKHYAFTKEKADQTENEIERLRKVN